VSLPGRQLLYMGNAAKKNLVLNGKALADLLGILITEHDKLPDVVLLAFA
jgi:hypothetical protein